MSKRPTYYADPMPLSDILYEIRFALPAGNGWDVISQVWSKERLAETLQGCKTINAALRKLAPIAREYAAGEE